MEQTILKISTIILCVLGIIYICRKKSKIEIFIDFRFWLLFSWIICIGLNLFSGINYSILLTLKSFLYIIAVLAIFIIGTLFSKEFLIDKINNYLNKKKSNVKKSFSQKLNMFPSFVFSTVCMIIYVIYMFCVNDIVFGVTRDINANWISTLFLIGTSLSLVVWLYELCYAILNNKMITWYGIISLIIFNVPGLIISGRDALIISLLATFITFLIAGYYMKRVLKKPTYIYNKIKKLSIFFCIIVLFYLVFLSSNRYGNSIDSALKIFEWSSQCTFPDYLKFIYYKLGGIGQVIINAIYYYSSQLSKFSLIFEEYNGPYLFGFYQLHYVSRLLPESWGLNYTLVSESIREITTNANIPGLRVFWETAIGYSIYDFGRIGTIIMSFFGGIIVGTINGLCQKNPRIITLILQAFICVGMFLTVELSPLFDYFYIFPFFWILVIFGFERFKNKAKK